MMKTPLLMEQHFHGCYGIDFNKATVEDMLEVSHKLLSEGIGYIFPTIVTDTVENTKRQVLHTSQTLMDGLSSCNISALFHSHTHKIPLL